MKRRHLARIISSLSVSLMLCGIIFPRATYALSVCAMGCDYTSIGEALNDPMSARKDVVVDPGTYFAGKRSVSVL